MGFEVIHNSPQAVWVPIEYSGTMYHGSIAALDVSAIADYSGAFMLPIAAGAWNTAFDVPFGVVIGDNNRKPLYNATAKTQYITSASPHGSTSEFVSTGGPYILGGREAMVKVDVIDPSTVLRGNLWVDTPGTAITVVTVAAGGGNTDGVAATTSDCDVATIEGWATIYFRTGANKGTYRQLDSATSTTVHEWNIPTYADVSAGDTAVVVNMRTWGISRANLVATYLNGFDVDHAVSSNYFGIDVLRLDLAEAGKEVVDFRWNAINFYPAAGRD